jgi:hypothetical protein
MTRRRVIAAAIIRRAQMRAAFQHFARNPDVGLTWIKARAFRPIARIFRHAFFEKDSVVVTSAVACGTDRKEYRSAPRTMSEVGRFC